MATLVLSQVGASIAGTQGSILGALVGGAADRAILGSPARSRRSTGELADQTLAYGGPVPRVYGRMRVAGTIIWASQFQDAHNVASGKSGSGGPGYSISLAIALSSTPAIGVRRIWADGKLIRSADGSVAVPVNIRFYGGSELQAPDPLIAAAEGVGETPAFRGMSYVVLEDLALSEFANRVPQLTFELISSNDPVHAYSILEKEIATGSAKCHSLFNSPIRIDGYVTNSMNSTLDIIEDLQVIENFVYYDSENTIHINQIHSDSTPIQLMPAQMGFGSNRESAAPANRRVRRSEKSISALSISYYDIDRDFEVSIQRAFSVREQRGGVDKSLAVPAAMKAHEVKSIADREVARHGQSDIDVFAFLVPEFICLTPGETLEIEGARYILSDGRLEDGYFKIEAVKQPSTKLLAADADVGKKAAGVQIGHGPTETIVVEPRTLPWESASEPRVIVGVRNTSGLWRSANVLYSLNRGSDYNYADTVTEPAVFGTTDTVLAPGAFGVLDRINDLCVTIQGDRDELASVCEQDLLFGNNLALVGAEILAFCTAQKIGQSSYVLSGLSRGLYGTEQSICGHEIGEQFLLLKQSSTSSIFLSHGYLGSDLLIKTTVPNGISVEPSPIAVRIQGRNLRPLAPAHLVAEKKADGSLSVSWIRRSRLGFVWLDGADAPLGEIVERYEVRVSDGQRILQKLVSVPTVSLSAAEISSIFGSVGGVLVVSVAQLSDVVGLGDITSTTVARP